MPLARGLVRNAALTHLDLAANGLTALDATALADALLANSTLRILDLRNDASRG